LKTVKVHKCFSADLGELLPPARKPKRKKGQLAYQGPLCKCREVVSIETAQDWVDGGIAQWWVVEKSIAVTGRSKQTPRGATIEKAHIERAYAFGGDEEERERIEEYGILTLLARVRIGRYFVNLKPEPAGGRANDWGRPIFAKVTEERTEGGIGVDMPPKCDMIVTEAKQ
jgi:hypothetical protein